jgi:hypothetical protein
MQPASGRGELAVQRPLGDPHDAVVMGDQCAYDSLLRFEAGVRCARGRLAEHQLQYAADDVQVGGFGPITDWVLRAGTGKEKQKNGNVVFGASHIECKALNENRKTIIQR